MNNAVVPLHSKRFEWGGLSVPGKLTRTEWHIPKGLKFDEWMLCGKALIRIGSAHQWWIGDWWAYGEDEFGKGHEYGARIKAWRESDDDDLLGGYTFGALQTMGWVARNLTTSLRREVLTFEHHKHVAPLPPDEQSRWLGRAVEGEDGEPWSSNKLKAEIARAAAIARTKAVELEAAKLGRFVVLYADPPWQYEHAPAGGDNRSIEKEYPTMSLEEICALRVDSIAHENAVLFLWSTSPKLEESLSVIEAWGFVYRTNMVWIKDKIGMGYHARERHECLLIAKRGELPPPPVEARPDSVVEAPRLEHSAKPRIFYDIIDRMYPGVRKIELFGRAPEDREGWQAWGNQA